MDQSAQRAGAVRGVEACQCQPFARGSGDPQGETAVLEPGGQSGDLQLHDPRKFLQAQRVKENHVVKPVQEFGPEVSIYHAHDGAAPGVIVKGLIHKELRTDIGGQHQDHIAEVHGTALPVGEPPVVEHLEKNVKHLGVRLLHFIEQDYAVGAAADSLSKLAAFLVADITRRGSNQPGDRVLLGILGHIDAHHGAFVIEKELSQRFGQFRLADPGRSEEQERTRRTVRVRHTRAGTAYSVGH